MYKYILFDLDGTLIDSSQGLLKSIDNTIAKFNFEQLDLDKKKSFIGPPILNSFKNEYNLTHSQAVEAMNYFREDYKSNNLYFAHVYEGIKELLYFLKNSGAKLAVATYKREDYAKLILEKFKLADYFDLIKGADHEGKLTKSDIIKICIDKLQATEEETILIGDSLNDYDGAKDNKVDFIPVTYGFGKFNKEILTNANFYADNTTQLLNYFKKPNILQQDINKLEFYVNKKNKGKLQYKIHLLQDGTFKIEILKNEHTGTHSSGALSLAEAKEMVNRNSGNSNNKAFWEVVLKDLELIGNNKN